MVRHAIRHLLGNRPDQTLLFGGFSAGARGCMVNIDYLKEIVRESTMIKGFIDSPGYQVYSTVLCNVESRCDPLKTQ
jgi:hypothetical protein